MPVDDAIALFTYHFQIFARRQEGYKVRFIAPPYTDHESDSALVYGRSKSPDWISGLDIICVLQKFGKTETEFKEAYNEFYGAGGKAKGRSTE